LIEKARDTTAFVVVVFDADPTAGLTASTTVSGPAADAAVAPIAAVIDAVAFGLINSRRTWQA
jgi:hypothetical protein